MTRPVLRERGDLVVAPDGAPWARIDGGNPLRDGLDPGRAAGGRLVCWSGTLAERLFDLDPRTWLAPGHEAWRAVCAEAAPALEAAGVRAAVRPHARHVLSDVQSTLAFLAHVAGGPFDLVLDPAALLEPSMAADVEDHLARMLESLGPRCAAVRLVETGALPADPLRALVDRHVPVATPIIVAGEADAGRPEA